MFYNNENKPPICCAVLDVQRQLNLGLLSFENSYNTHRNLRAFSVVFISNPIYLYMCELYTVCSASFPLLHRSGFLCIRALRSCIQRWGEHSNTTISSSTSLSLFGLVFASNKRVFSVQRATRTLVA